MFWGVQCRMTWLIYYRIKTGKNDWADTLLRLSTYTNDSDDRQSSFTYNLLGHISAVLKNSFNGNKQIGYFTQVAA